MVRENVDRTCPRSVCNSSIKWSTSNNGPTGITCKDYAVHFESMGSSILSIPIPEIWIDERISKHAVTENGTTPHRVEHRSVQRNAGLSKAVWSLTVLPSNSAESSALSQWFDIRLSILALLVSARISIDPRRHGQSGLDLSQWIDVHLIVLALMV